MELQSLKRKPTMAQLMRRLGQKKLAERRAAEAKAKVLISFSMKCIWIIFKNLKKKKENVVLMGMLQKIVISVQWMKITLASRNQKHLEEELQQVLNQNYLLIINTYITQVTKEILTKDRRRNWSQFKNLKIFQRSFKFTLEPVLWFLIGHLRTLLKSPTLKRKTIYHNNDNNNGVTTNMPESLLWNKLNPWITEYDDCYLSIAK